MNVVRRVPAVTFFLVIFGVLAWLVHSVYPPVAALEVKRVARDFSDAWMRGTLDQLSYDPASDPEKGDDPAGVVATDTAAMTKNISPYDKDRPIDVHPVGDPKVNGNGSASQELSVSWDLGQNRTWTYSTTLTLARSDGRLRVLWSPQTVHPYLVHGLALRSHRLLAARAPVLDDRGAVLAPTSPSGLAGELLGNVAPATEELTQLDKGRIELNDPTGTTGLQRYYDKQLAGSAGLEIDVVRATTGQQAVEPIVRIANVTPPTPGRPLSLTLDTGWQQRAEAALANRTAPAALVALDLRNGRILAVANGGRQDPQQGDPTERGVQGQFAPGDAFRLVTTLAAIRTADLPPATTPTSCAPYDFGGQQFRNAAGVPGADNVTLATAFAQNCRTAVARIASTLTPQQLHDAGASLGFEQPAALGFPAYLGTVPTASASPQAGDDATVAQIQNGIGEGSVLANPLVLARMSATIANGFSVVPSLVLNPPQTAPATTQTLSGTETATLQTLMQTSVQQDAALAPLRGGTPAVAAVGGIAVYGPSPSAPLNAWVTGYRGDVAFAVLLTKTDADGPRQAATAAARFLGLLPASGA